LHPDLSQCQPNDDIDFGRLHLAQETTTTKKKKKSCINEGALSLQLHYINITLALNHHLVGV